MNQNKLEKSWRIILVTAPIAIICAGCTIFVIDLPRCLQNSFIWQLTNNTDKFA